MKKTIYRITAINSKGKTIPFEAFKGGYEEKDFTEMILKPLQVISTTMKKVKKVNKLKKAVTAKAKRVVKNKKK